MKENNVFNASFQFKYLQKLLDNIQMFTNGNLGTGAVSGSVCNVSCHGHLLHLEKDMMNL